jgi:radical SAM protein with 4Fe4S-binding SPASM domain
MATVILKASERCNSNCVYCDVVFKQHTGADMPLEVLEQMFFRANDFLLARSEERLEILWHGGEPLILGPDYYREAIRLQNCLCPETKGRIRHSIQSNLTLFSEPFVEIFRELGITGVGTSYDPEPHVRGPGKQIDSDTYNRMFMTGLRLIEKNGFSWGMIYVVTKKSLRQPLEVFSFLTNLTLEGRINFNPVLIYDEQRRDIAITPEEYVEFLGAIFPTWWQHRNRYPEVTPFKMLVDCIVHGNLNLGCADSGACSHGYINVAPDGGASHCGRSADWGLLDYGNISDRTFAEILQDQQREQLAARNEILPQGECQGCRFWDLCHGGCPLDAHSRHRSFSHKSEWCEAKKGFIEKYFEPVTGARYEPKGH